MPPLWRVFPTVADCQTYCDQSWVSMVRGRAAGNGNILFDYLNGRRPVNIAPLPDQALIPQRFPILGRNVASGVINMDSGFTTAWASPMVTASGEWAAPCIDPNDPHGVPEPEWPPSPDPFS